ncbi:MAG: hypothetical protein RR386_03810 [Bacteroidaceae bacterium]
MRRIAVNRLHLKNGQLLLNQVIELDKNTLHSYFPLKQELPYTEWLGGDFYE